MDCALITTFILAMFGVMLVITGISMQFITNWQLKSKVADVRIALFPYGYFLRLFA